MLLLTLLAACSSEAPDTSATRREDNHVGDSAEEPCTPSSEACNGIDDDCDGYVDNVGGVRRHVFDEDGDGALVVTQDPCPADPPSPEDCDDNDPAVYPGATEACNGIDDDCDHERDEYGAEGCAATWLDLDADGYWGTEVCSCTPLGPSAGDCDDLDPRLASDCALLDADALDASLRIDGLDDAATAQDCDGDASADFHVSDSRFSFPSAGRYALADLHLIDTTANADWTDDGVCDELILESDDTWLNSEDEWEDPWELEMTLRWTLVDGATAEPLANAALVARLPISDRNDVASFGPIDGDGDGRLDLFTRVPDNTAESVDLYLAHLDGTDPELLPASACTLTHRPDWIEGRLTPADDADLDGNADFVLDTEGPLLFPLTESLCEWKAWGAPRPAYYAPHAAWGDVHRKGIPAFAYVSEEGGADPAEPAFVFTPADGELATFPVVAGGAVQSMHIEDLTGDGQPELVVAYAWASGTDVAVWEGVAAGEITVASATSMWRFDADPTVSVLAIDAVRGVQLHLDYADATLADASVWVAPAP